jgi:hypothetical protein
MSKHTPGPWEAKGTDVFAGKNCIGICDTDNDTQKRMEANARLMAAAPDLLAALQSLVASCEKHLAFRKPTNPVTRDRMAVARAAIAKAGA